MQPKPRRDHLEYEVLNRNRLKLTPGNLKGVLRRKSSASNRLIESPENSDDEEYQEKLLNRGSQWWKKVDHRFFRQVRGEDVESLERRTTSQELLQLKYPARRLQVYFQEQIYPLHPSLLNLSLLKVLFRREVRLDGLELYALATYSFRQHEQPQPPANPRLDSKLHLSCFRLPPEQLKAADQEQLNHLELQLMGVEWRTEEIKKILDFEVRRVKVEEEVERELQLWSEQLSRTHTNNTENWGNMRDRFDNDDYENSRIDGEAVEAEVEAIRKELRMAEVLLRFKRGHGDKTEQMLEEALEVAKIKDMSLKEDQQKKKGTKIEQLKCLFETDCKICFCTESDHSHQVVYCEACKTSFHQACYGLPSLPTPFHCEVCRFVKLNTSHDRDNPRTPRKPICQLCCKPNFPMRQLTGHFYHVTCLVLFDLVDIRDYQIELKTALTHEDILQRVVENQVSSEPCAYCVKEAGMKFACQAEGCSEHFHPICAYLNGVHFDLQRNHRSLAAALTCPHHHPDRDALNQVYLRRFFCDYKATSNKTDAEFEQVYKREQDDRYNNRQTKTRDLELGVLKRGKAQRPAKPLPKPVRSLHNSAKKESEEINSVGADSEVATETRKLMQRLSDSSNRDSIP